MSLWSKLIWAIFLRVPYGLSQWKLFFRIILLANGVTRFRTWLLDQRRVTRDCDFILACILFRLTSLNGNHYLANRILLNICSMRNRSDDSLFPILRLEKRPFHSGTLQLENHVRLKLYGKKVGIVGPIGPIDWAQVNKCQIIFSTRHPEDFEGVPYVFYLRSNRARGIRANGQKITLGRQQCAIIKPGTTSTGVFDTTLQHRLTNYQPLMKGSKIGSLNAVQDMLLISILNGAKHVSLSNFDFGLTRNYVPGYNHKKAPLMHMTFGAHPPLLQFIITQNLLSLVSHTLSKELAELLSYSREQFALKLKQSCNAGE